MNTRNVKRTALCVMMLIINACGAALTLKAGIGAGAWDTLAQTVGTLSGIRVGTVGMLFNFSCILVELLVLRKQFRIKNAIQIVPCLLIGYFINFFYYSVLGGLSFSSYFFRIAALITGYLITSFSCAVIMLLNVMTFSLEGACTVVSDKTKIPMHRIRQLVDVISIALSLFLPLIFQHSIVMREGTVIGMLLYGSLLGMFMKLMRPVLRKYSLTDCPQLNLPADEMCFPPHTAGVCR